MTVNYAKHKLTDSYCLLTWSMFRVLINTLKASEYDQKMPQAHTTDQHTALSAAGLQIRLHNWKLFILVLNQNIVVGTQKNRLVKIHNQTALLFVIWSSKWKLNLCQLLPGLQIRVSNQNLCSCFQPKHLLFVLKRTVSMTVPSV